MPVTISAGGARAVIRPECGGTVESIELLPPGELEAVPILRGDGAAGEELSGEGSAIPEGECSPRLFRGRLLAPFNDRIPGGRYSFRGESYRLPINDEESGDAIHGFLYRTAMAIKERKEGTLRLISRIRPGEEPGYPFDLELSATYRLRGDRFRLDLTGKNLGDRPLPLTLGWHPYFRRPGADRIDGALLTLPAERYVAVDRDLLPTGKTPPVAGGPWDFRSPRRIGPGEIDLAFELFGGAGGATAELRGGERSVEVRPGGACRYLQLFVPPRRDSVAIEPVTAGTDAFNRPELGLRAVEPGETLTLTAEVRIR